jgi:peptidoglycan-associated lipoprotein
MIRISYNYLILAFCFLSLNLYPQDRRVENAMKVYQAGEYHEAIEVLKDAYDRVESNEEKADILYKIADSHRKINEPLRAELWFKNAIRRGYEEPIVHYYYAQALKQNEKYEEAIEQFNIYLKEEPDDERAIDGIRSCEIAQEWKANPTGYIIEQAHFFNSRSRDYAPAFAKDDYGVVYFTSTREEATGEMIHGATGERFADIFMSKRDRQGRWSVPVPVEGEVNTEHSEGTPSLDGSYNKLYFTRCEFSRNRKKGCQIYVSTKDGDQWGKPEQISLIEDDTLIVAHPAISKDGNTLYFVSDMPGGYGGMDIWYTKKVGGDWAEPVNAGSQINTAGNEVFPYLHADGTLYFSSDGHLGMGGLDVFKTEEIQKGWKVVNMGHPFNSKHDDCGVIFEDDAERGYLSSSRGIRRTGDDIYAFVLPPVRFNVIGAVVDDEGEPVESVEIRLLGSDGSTMESMSDDKGRFRFMLKPGTDYVITTVAEGYLRGRGNVSTRGKDQAEDFNVEIVMPSIDDPIELPNIFYDFAKWTLREESKEALDQLVETLNENPEIVIELMAHTDARGSAEANMELSQQRAQSVVDYLIESGIDPDRLVPKGYGESQPKTVDEQMATNMPFFKEGDVLTEEYIKALASEDYREIAHQINRRTEFKVLSTDYKPKNKRK